LSYAAQGFITVLPHWQGYDDPTRKHNYFIARLEASIMLDATRAVYELFNKNLLPNVPARPAQAVFYGGYSQGGHGAFAALDAASQYAPELPIKGVVGHATAPDVEAILRERPPLARTSCMLINYYGDHRPRAIFLSNWLPTFYTMPQPNASMRFIILSRRPKAALPLEFLDALYTGIGRVPAGKRRLNLICRRSPDTSVPSFYSTVSGYHCYPKRTTAL
jgi:hypothetical protein